MSDKLQEQIAARKAKNEAKNAKKGTRKPRNTNSEVEKEENSIIAIEETEILRNMIHVTSEELAETFQPVPEMVNVSTIKEENDWEAFNSGNPQIYTNLVEGSQEALQDVLTDLATTVLPWSENGSNQPTDNVESISKVDIEADTTIDFSNGKSWPAKKVTIGGVGTLEGAYFGILLREVFYVLSLGGKFESAEMPRFKGLPLMVKMKIPLDKYKDYLDRKDYPDYNDTKEYYNSTMTALDVGTLLNALEKNVEKGVEVDPKIVATNQSRYVVPIRTRHPVESKPGWHCKQRDPIKYSREELDNMEWYQIVAIKNLYGIESVNRLGVVSKLVEIFGN